MNPTELNELTTLDCLREAGFTFPHELGLFRHPMLTADGQPIDPQAHGFAIRETGGGCEALELHIGEFVMVVTHDDGCYVPEPHEWSDALIGIYRADRSVEVIEVALVTGQQWLKLVEEAEASAAASN